ncbi:MAG: LysR family transcriptional regulator [Bacteroidales bacterium]|nr:LysR family transcriptional regulator [Bacteroidales bacterium]
MEIRQLKYFISVAEAGSFSEASRRVFLSQSAISQQIKALEDELNTTLFIRTSHHISLTESGETLLPLAKQMVRDMQTCINRINDYNNAPRGELRIGLTYSLEPYIRHTISNYLKNYPKVTLHLCYKSINELHQLLLHHELDLVLSIDNRENATANIISEPIIDYKLCAIMRDAHPLAYRQKLSFQDLKMQGFILPEPSIRDRNAVEHFLHAETGDINVRAIVNDPNALLNLIQSTNHITILSEKVIMGRNNLRAIELDELSTPVMVYAKTLRNSYRKRSASLFIDMLKDHCKNCIVWEQ